MEHSAPTSGGLSPSQWWAGTMGSAATGLGGAQHGVDVVEAAGLPMRTSHGYRGMRPSVDPRRLG